MRAESKAAIAAGVSGASVIFANSPADWQELESRVHQILVECGCQGERGKHLDLPRGSVDVDVYARDVTREPALTILECKQWQSAVPKNVVHGFHTVMDEVGANVGFIISANGFQSGAVEAAKNTNIHLVTWQEFQSRFYDRWFEAMRLKLAEVADEVFAYSDYFHRRTTSVLHAIPERVEELQTLWKRCSAYSTATSYHQMVKPYRPVFPLQIIDPRAEEITAVTVPDARAYFDLLFASGPQAIDAYERFITKYTDLDAAQGRQPDLS
jgi:hypothetical protein